VQKVVSWGVGVVALCAVLAGCSSGGPNVAFDRGGQQQAAPSTSSTSSTTTSTSTTTTLPPGPGADWTPVATAGGRPVVWTRTLVVDGTRFVAAVFDHRATTLALHARGAIQPAERGAVVAAFNGGFEFNTGVTGMTVGGATTGRFGPDLAAVVSYADGGVDVGAWGRDVPAAGRQLVSARSNLHLLVDGGTPASEAATVTAWGAPLRSVGWRTARSSLGVRADGDLVWVGSTATLTGPLAAAQIAAGAVRAMQLDINPWWVCLFAFNGGTPTILLPGQTRPAATYLNGWSRDFFTIAAR